MSNYCEHESVNLDDKKSYCELWERWTNCREAGRCLYEVYAKPKQMTLDLEN